MNKIRYYVFLVSLCFASTSFSQEKEVEIGQVIEESLSFSASQAMKMYDILKADPGKLPKTYENGKLVRSTDKWWTSGFYPGALWYLYEFTGNRAIADAAREMSGRVINQQYTTDNHDVGFMINCSFGNGYRLTSDARYKEVLITASRSLSTRFRPAVGCIRSWDNRRWQYPVIIDNMMNLELLCNGTKLSGDTRFLDIAKSHADVSMANQFRPDGSSYHVISYDTITGKAIEKCTHQGLNDASAWSRGQAWGLYGYTVMYRETKDVKYLKHAIEVGNFIADHPRLPKDGIPYWDFDVPDTTQVLRDASAGAVMASAFLELSTYTEGKQAEKFLKLADRQIRSLSSSTYRATLGDNGNFILKHSVGFMAKKSEVDVPLTYADYYYVEALIRYRKLLSEQKHRSGMTERQLWVDALTRIADPVLTNLSRNTLRANMPVEVVKEAESRNREVVTHLEAFGRVMTGIAPWLELGPDQTEEGQLRKKYIDLSIKALKNGVNPSSPDYLNFTKDRQPLVDAAFLAHGLLRAPRQLWGNLDKQTRERLVYELKSTRAIKPNESNWLLFSAMIEAALLKFTGECNMEPINYAIRKHQEWYKGDAMYGDGPAFHNDYYNSFVIQPMLLDVLSVLKEKGLDEESFYDTELVRFIRYAEQQERLISPEGTFPPIGRSLVYRFGAFQALSQVALMKQLPGYIVPAQVRSALTTVIERQINQEGTFDANGWLQLGFCGHQPEVAETYISTGSLYLCSAVFLPLGLPSDDNFWTGKYTEWTSVKAWSGKEIRIDKALKK